MRNIMKLQRTHAAVLFLGGAMLTAVGQAAADQVIPDDLIVQGSICTGLDCVNNESFSFATLRLKENNTRIDFTDTSASGFATRDWRIEANASGSGAASYLAIKDMGNSATGQEGGTAILTATAGAPANSLFISDIGRVGLGTSTPVLHLHVSKGDTPAIRLEQNNSGGWDAQTWDVAGNEANFFVRDATEGSRLPFRIRPRAPTSSIDISADGNVGIGTASPLTKLHLFASGVVPVVTFFENSSYQWSVGMNAASKFRISDNTAAVDRVTIDTTGQFGIGTSTPAAQFHTTGSVRFAGVANCSAGIQSSAAGDLSCVSSSRQFKTIAGVLEPTIALANVMALRPQVGTYRLTPDEPEHWLIAEDVAAVDPALAGFRHGEPYTVKTQNVVADLVAVIQEQQRRIEDQQRRIETLERKIVAQ